MAGTYIQVDNGMGTFLRTIRTFVPAGSATDSANLQALLTAMAGVGEVRIAPGTTLLSAAAGSSALDFSACSNLVVVGHPNSRMVCTATAAGGGVFNNFAWKAFPTETGSGTFASTPTFGAKTVSSDTSFSVGNIISFTSVNAARAFLAARYVVKAVSGSGPYTLTLDRPLLFPFASGDAIKLVTNHAQNITIEGNGMRLDGTGDRLVEFLRAYRCYIRNVRFGADDSAGVPVDVASFDIGSLECAFEDCDVYCPGSSQCLMLESCERSQIIRGRVDSGGDGIVLWDSVGCAVEDSFAAGCASTGLALDSNTMSIGCKDILIRGGIYSRNTANGVGVSKSSDVHIVGARADDNGIGFYITPTVVRLTVEGCKTARNSTSGMQLASTCTETRVLAHSDQASAVGIQIDGGDVFISGYHCTGSVSGQAMRVDGGTVVARGLQLTPTTTANTVYQTGGTLDVEGGSVAGASSAINCAGGVLRVHDITTSGAGVGVYNSAGAVRFGGNCNLGSTTPARNDNGQANASHDVEYQTLIAGALGSATTLFVGPDNFDATEATVSATATRRMLLRDIVARVGTAPSSGKTLTLTLRVNEADTAVVTTIAGTATTGTKDAAANSTTVLVVPGDRYCIKAATDSGNAAADLRATIAGIGA